MASSDNTDFENNSFSVRYVKAARVKGRIILGISSSGEDCPYSLSESVYYSLGSPSRGDVLSSEDVEAIKIEDEGYRALKSALSILSYADNSRRSLYLKLLRKGYSKDMARSAVEECVRLGYIREDEQLRRAIIREANTSLYGRRRITDKLLSHGYSLRAINEVLDGLVGSGEIDFEENFMALCEKKLSGEQINKENIHALRYKYGY